MINSIFAQIKRSIKMKIHFPSTNIRIERNSASFTSYWMDLLVYKSAYILRAISICMVSNVGCSLIPFHCFYFQEVKRKQKSSNIWDITVVALIRLAGEGNEKSAASVSGPICAKGSYRISMMKRKHKQMKR